MPKRDTSALIVNMYSFDKLMQDTIQNAMWLQEYFRLNLIYYKLVSGKGLDFDRIRDYYVGADPKRIDWKKHAKTGQLYVRQFKEERQFDVVIVLDVSDSMLLGTTQFTKNEFSAMMGGTFMYAGYEAGDNIALMMVSDKIELATEPSADFTKLMSLATDKANYGGKKNWKRMVELLNINYGEQTIIFLISDFLDTNVEAFLPDLAARFSKVYGIMVRDPVDVSLPQGVGRMALQDTAGNKVYITDLDKVRLEYEILAKRNIEKIREVFQEYGQLFFHATPGDSFGRSFIEAVGAVEVDLS